MIFRNGNQDCHREKNLIGTRMHPAIASLFVTGLLFAAAGCAHTPKASDSSTQAAVNSATVQDQDMALDRQGSDSHQIPGLQSIHFAFDRSNIDAEAGQLIKKNIDWMVAHPKMKMEIQGHCDRHGSVEYNMALGERRANAVKAYMVSLGVDKDRLSTISYGKEKLLDLSETSDADLVNRRANFLPLPNTSQHIGSNTPN